MNIVSYDLAAELYPARRRNGSNSLGYKRFTSLAKAVKFAIEDLPANMLLGTYLETEDQRYDHAGIRALYESEHYPLKRLRKTA